MLKRLIFIFLLVSLLIFPVEPINAQQVYDFSNTPDLHLSLLTFNAQSGLAAGIFVHKAPDKKVAISNGWVEPVGAGIFLGSDKTQVRDGICWFAVSKKEKNEESYLERCPIEVKIYDFWHQSEVENDTKVIDQNGEEFLVGIGKPLKGAIGRIEIKSRSMVKFQHLALESNGQVKGGVITFKSLGRCNVRFVSKLGSAIGYVILDSSGIERLRSILPEEDRQIFSR